MSNIVFNSARGIALGAGAATALVGAQIYNTTRCLSRDVKSGNKNDRDDDNQEEFRVEVHLMDKIQQKKYLEDARQGIPSTLRILAIDLPEMRTKAFSGDCRLSHDKVFADDVAPPKVIEISSSSNEEDEYENDDNGEDGVVGEDGNKRKNTKRKKKNQKSKLKIAQKALVKSIVHCRSEQSQQRVGVELLEASVADLNRYKLRKTHQFGNFKYDPGKYYGSYSSTSSGTGRTSSSSKKKSMSRTTTERNQSKRNNSKTDDDDDDTEIAEVDQAEIMLDKATFEDEIEAPWNQYAWAEEMRLRVNGQVPFGSPMEKSSTLQQYVFGNAYKISIHPVHKFWEWPLPSFAKSDPDGVDGSSNMKNNCRAANKPHAVIANGAALQRVPSSLRLLQKVCRTANVPLFVVHDPRVWGGNTHETLADALHELRQTIKGRIILQALKLHGSSAFTRGRMLGQLETETKWQIKENKRRTKTFFTRSTSNITTTAAAAGSGGIGTNNNTNDTYPSTGTGKRRRSSSNDDKKKDWSKFDLSLLEKKLMEHNVIHYNNDNDNEKKKQQLDGGAAATKKSVSVQQEQQQEQRRKTYSPAMIQLAHQCVNDE